MFQSFSYKKEHVIEFMVIFFLIYRVYEDPEKGQTPCKGNVEFDRFAKQAKLREGTKTAMFANSCTVYLN